MSAVLTLTAGFLLAVLWFDLMFDVQVLGRRPVGEPLAEQVLASIAAPARHDVCAPDELPRRARDARNDGWHPHPGLCGPRPRSDPPRRARALWGSDCHRAGAHPTSCGTARCPHRLRGGSKCSRPRHLPRPPRLLSLDCGLRGDPAPRPTLKREVELFNPARCSVRDDLPERTEGILPDVAIRSNDDEAVRDRLADQHAVERVSMERREPGEVKRRLLVER